MRYRMGETAGTLGEPVSQSAYLSSAALSFLIGLGFIYAGLRSRHYWMVVWGIGLSVSSTIYIGYTS